MSQYKAQTDKEGGGVVKDYGWCDFIATPKYRKNYYDIWGNTCTKCRKKKAAKDKIWCTKCDNGKEADNG